MQDVSAVSYTHLDVYKRQIYGRAVAWSFLITDSCGLHMSHGHVDSTHRLQFKLYCKRSYLFLIGKRIERVVARTCVFKISEACISVRFTIIIFKTIAVFITMDLVCSQSSSGDFVLLIVA